MNTRKLKTNIENQHRTTACMRLAFQARPYSRMVIKFYHP